MTRRKAGIVFLTALLTGAILLIFQWFSSRDKKYDWTERYQPEGRMPYDTRIFNNLLKQYNRFDQKNTIKTRRELQTFILERGLEPRTLVFLDSDYYPDEQHDQELLNWVSRGNTLLIIASSGQQEMVSRLVDESCMPEDSYPVRQGQDSLVPCYLYHGSFRGNNPVIFDYRFRGKREIYYWHFYSGELFCERSTLIPLGFIGNGNVNFISKSFGKGKILLHCEPLLFTNYQLSDSTRQSYARRVLSYIPDGPVFLDRASNYPAPSYGSGRETGSPLAFILANRSLRWAYYIVLATVFVYLLTGLRRQQRIIPVIEPLRNSTAAFVRTSGLLMMRHKEHAALFKEQNKYFHAFIREKYRINALKLQDDEIDVLSGRSGVPTELISRILQTAEKLSLYVEIGERDVLYFHELLSEFFKLCRK